MLVVSSEKRMTNWHLKPRITPASFPNHPAATVACKLVSVRRVTAEDQTARFLHFVIQQSCTRYSSTLLWAIHRILITVQVQTRSATQQLTQNEKQLIGSHPPSPICLDSSLHHSGDACRPVWPLTLIKVTCMHLLPWKSNSLNCWTHISMVYLEETDNAKLNSSSNMFLHERVCYFITPTYLTDEAL